MKDIITKFYTSFQQLDAESMAECYHPKIIFEDPAFGKLQGIHVENMWKMLCQNATNLEISFSSIIIENQTAKAKWEATYIFNATGRKVHNIIHAEFEFKEGKIIKHTDNFNLHKWASQSLGIKGWILGGTSFFKRKLNSQTRKLLSTFENKQN